MTKPLEDKDLIEVFEDGISRAIEAIQPSELVISFYNGPHFLDGVQKAAVAANGLAHTQANPKWLAVRDGLENLVKLFKTLIIAGKQPPRAKIVSTLRGVLFGAHMMVSAKSMNRQDVLATLDVRKNKYLVT